MVQLVSGVYLSPLKIIEHEKGNILHVLKNSDTVFSGFGEAYFSTIKKGEFKGWKLHREMILNIVVPTGAIRFYFLKEPDETGNVETATTVLSADAYYLLTVKPGIWMGFTGLEDELNLLLNVASIPHDPLESVNAVQEKWMHFFNQESK
jgi:dTDP-4-dehydrorhamnose 3,5-epimerase